ncbi:MAG: hypothetical protein ACI4EA_04840 [Candidatus Ornithomonoglobus sp.]
MKRVYNEPFMNISLFSRDDVVTTSGTAPKTAHDQAVEWLNDTSEGTTSVEHIVDFTL